MGKKFSELERTSSLNNGDLFAVAQVDAQAQTGYKSKSTETSAVAQKLLKGIEFPTDLQTDDKTVLGAINELNSMVVISDIASGALANFKTSLEMPLKSLNVDVNAVQEAGTPTPSSPKAISGRSNVKITKCGKNLIDNNDIYTYGKWKDDLVTVGDFPTNSSNRGYSLPTIPGETYTISFGIDASNIPTYVYLCKSDGETSSRIAYITSGSSLMNRTYTFTADGNLYYLRSGSMATEENFNVQTAKFGYVQLESGSVATEYVIYNGNVINIPLGDSYYGGYVSQDKAGHRQFVVTHEITDLGELNWGYSVWGAGSVFSASIPLVKEQTASGVKGDIICSIYNNVTANEMYNSNPNYSMCLNRDVVRIANSDYSNKDTFKTAMSGIMLVYPLETPIVIDLPDGDPITSLEGENNVYADTGNSTVEYYLSIKDYIDNQIAAVQALVLNS